MTRNLFETVPDNVDGELIEALVESSGMRIERIVSTGQASPVGFWYDQPQTEWVCVVAGEAVLRFEGKHETVRLVRGDYLIIPAREKHRVEWTTPSEPTIWIAVFYDELNTNPPD